MKFGQIGPTFVDPGKTVIFWMVKSVVSSSTLKMRKSQKKLAPVYAYTHVYARKRDGGVSLQLKHFYIPTGALLENIITAKNLKLCHLKFSH